MPSLSRQQRQLVGALGAATRHHPEQADRLRRDLKASKAEDYIKRLVAEAPALTTEQRDRLVVLLRGAA